MRRSSDRNSRHHIFSPAGPARWTAAHPRGPDRQSVLGLLTDVAAEHHGRSPHEVLATYFASDLIGPVRGERFARALEPFWAGDYDISSHVLAPPVESVLRSPRGAESRSSRRSMRAPRRWTPSADAPAVSNPAKRGRSTVEMSPPSKWCEEFETQFGSNRRGEDWEESLEPGRAIYRKIVDDGDMGESNGSRQPAAAWSARSSQAWRATSFSA